jgi:hypothetical protein
MRKDDAAVGGAGLLLARDYHRHVIQPLLARWCPAATCAAARIGAGSDVLGLDDVMSQDHDWGLRLQLFTTEQHIPEVRAALSAQLPETFRGHPTRIAFSGQATKTLGVDVTSVARFADERLGFDPRRGATTPDWLSVSGQAALEIVSGEVFADPDGGLTRLRQSLTWYPDDLWRYLVASDWKRLDQELPSMGRAGDRGDEMGAQIIAARLVDIAVHLAFMLSRTWRPYSKWRGTSFAQLPVSASITDDLEAALTSTLWSARSHALGRALESLALLQRDVGLPTRSPAVVPFWGRPYLNIEASLISALTDAIEDPAIRSLPVGLGGIDQRTDNVDILVDVDRRRAVVGA